MNDRFGGERNRYGAQGRPFNDERSGARRGRDDERSGWGRDRDDDESGWRSEGREPQFSSDYDETYGSEWDRNRNEGERGGSRQQRPGSYGQGERSGWYNRGNAGQYGSGGSGGYSGGYAGSSGYGGSSGTDYRRSGGYGGGSGYGGASGYGYGRGSGSFGGGSFGGRGSFGASSYDPAGFASGSYGRGEIPERGRGGFAGRGPKGYTRTDDRIREDVCDRLSRDDDVDASEIEVKVENGEVTLEGTVQTRSMKHQAEDIAEEVQGVTDVHNRLRVIKSMLNELKDKITGEDERHYANSGTKTTHSGSVSSSTGTNGTL